MHSVYLERYAKRLRETVSKYHTGSRNVSDEEAEVYFSLQIPIASAAILIVSTEWRPSKHTQNLLR